MRADGFILPLPKGARAEACAPCGSSQLAGCRLLAVLVSEAPLNPAASRRPGCGHFLFLLKDLEKEDFLKIKMIFIFRTYLPKKSRQPHDFLFTQRKTGTVTGHRPWSCWGLSSNFCDPSSAWSHVATCRAWNWTAGWLPRMSSLPSSCIAHGACGSKSVTVSPQGPIPLIAP